MRCPVCDASSRQPVLKQVLMGRHEVGYEWCGSCGLLQTEAPYWLDEAYAQAIADTDTGIVQRNLANARLLNVLLRHTFNPDGHFVDIAGGYGLLTRLLRDQGFDCWRSDKYCANLFADGFEPYEGLQAEALFAFEVLEHLPDPLAFLSEQFQRFGCRALVFSTLTFGETVPDADWWYYSTDSGQHVSFYQPRTLAAMAAKLGCHYVKIDRQTHVFTPHQMNRVLQEVLQRPALRRQLENWCWNRNNRPSLVWPDYQAAKQRLQAGRSAALTAAP